MRKSGTRIGAYRDLADISREAFDRRYGTGLGLASVLFYLKGPELSRLHFES